MVPVRTLLIQKYNSFKAYTIGIPRKWGPGDERIGIVAARPKIPLSRPRWRFAYFADTGKVGRA